MGDWCYWLISLVVFLPLVCGLLLLLSVVCCSESWCVSLFGGASCCGLFVWGLVFVFGVWFGVRVCCGFVIVILLRLVELL